MKEVTLIDLLKKAILPEEKIPVVTGKVKSVEGDSCTVIIDGQELTDVRLKATINGSEDKLLLTPKVGSLVLIGSLTGDLKDLCVLRIDELDKLELKQGGFELVADVRNSKVSLKADEIEFNEGLNDGMVLLHKLEGNLDQLKQYVEAMNSALPSAFTAVGIGSSADGTKAAGDYSGSMSGRQILFENMENAKIKQ